MTKDAIDAIASNPQPAPVQQEPVGEGWKLVPVEPTEDMWKAVNKLDDEMAAGSYDGKGCSIEQAWNCLLDAAPTPPSQRKPLTREQVKGMLTDAGYDTANLQARWDFRNGVQQCEAAHGIKDQP